MTLLYAGHLAVNHVLDREGGGPVGAITGVMDLYPFLDVPLDSLVLTIHAWRTDRKVFNKARFKAGMYHDELRDTQEPPATIARYCLWVAQQATKLPWSIKPARAAP